LQDELETTDTFEMEWNFKEKWKNFINTLRCIPCPRDFISVITSWIWHFVCDHYVIQYTRSREGKAIITRCSISLGILEYTPEFSVSSQQNWQDVFHKPCF